MPGIDIKEIEYWISRYEKESNELGDCVTLSALYIIRDHLLGYTRQEPRISAYSEAAPVEEKLDQYGESDFLQAVAGKSPEEAWAVMDELMDTLRVVNQRSYESVMRKLDRI